MPKERTIYFPLLPTNGNLARLNLAHTWGAHNPLRLLVDRTQCVGPPAVGEVNPRALQLRRRAMPCTGQCSYSERAGPSMTRTSPWSSRIEEGTLPDARRRTMNSTEFPKLKLTMSLGKFCGPNKDSLSLCQRTHDPEPAYWFRFTPVGTSFLPHQGDKKGATLPHKPTTPSQMALLVCGLTAAPRPYLYGHRQSCPGVTQAVSYVPREIHPTRR